MNRPKALPIGTLELLARSRRDHAARVRRLASLNEQAGAHIFLLRLLRHEPDGGELGAQVRNVLRSIRTERRACRERLVACRRRIRVCERLVGKKGEKRG